MSFIKKILIVDDSFNNLLLLEDLLTEMDYEVHVARDGVEALFKLKEFIPDLVLLDIMMPKMGGFELMEKMKENGLGNIPIVFITAKSSDEERRKAMDMGAAGFIAKPVIISEILDTVAEILKPQEKRH